MEMVIVWTIIALILGASAWVVACCFDISSMQDEETRDRIKFSALMAELDHDQRMRERRELQERLERQQQETP